MFRSFNENKVLDINEQGKDIVSKIETRQVEIFKILVTRKKRMSYRVAPTKHMFDTISTTNLKQNTYFEFFNYGFERISDKMVRDF